LAAEAEMAQYRDKGCKSTSASIFVKNEATNVSRSNPKARIVVDNGMAATLADHPVFELIEKTWSTYWGHHTIKYRLVEDVMADICGLCQNAVTTGCTDGANFDMTIGEDYKKKVENHIMAKAYEMILGAHGYCVVRDANERSRLTPTTTMIFEKRGKKGEDSDRLVITLPNNILRSGDRGTSTLNGIGNYFFHFYHFADLATVNFEKQVGPGECHFLTRKGSKLFFFCEGDDSIYALKAHGRSDGVEDLEELRETLEDLGLNPTIEYEDQLGFVGNVVRRVGNEFLWMPDVARGLKGHGRSSLPSDDADYHSVARMKYLAYAIRHTHVPFAFNYYATLSIHHSNKITGQRGMALDRETEGTFLYALGIDVPSNPDVALFEAAERHRNEVTPAHVQMVKQLVPEIELLAGYSPENDGPDYHLGATCITRALGLQ
jgi:hypothetical protein